jgi:hypothetical protein
MNVHDVHSHVRFVLLWCDLADWSKTTKRKFLTTSGSLVESTANLVAFMSLAVFTFSDVLRKGFGPLGRLHAAAALVASRRQQAFCPSTANAHSAMGFVRVGS